MARDGKSNPFDGSGGAPGNVNAYQRANAPRPTPPGAPRNPETVAPGGPLPFQPPPSREGQMVGAGSPGKPLPVKLGG
jgi:hypothetical protein